MTPGSKYVQLLQQAPRNNGTVGSGLAQALRQGLQGYVAGQEARAGREKKDKLTALLRGAGAPIVGPGPGGTAPAPAAGATRPSLAAQLADIDPEMALRARLQEQENLAAAQRSERERQQGFEDWKRRQEYLTANTPKLETVNNPFGRGGVGQLDPRTGAITNYQAPDRDKRYLTVPSVGVYDTMTGTYVGEGAPNGAPAQPGPAFPAPPGDPLAAIPPSKRPTAQVNELSGANQQIADMRKELAPKLLIAEQAKRFGELLDIQNTGGPLRQMPFAGSIEGAFDPQIQEMSAIVDRITPIMRQGLPGAASDRDVAMFRGAAFGVDKRPETNRNLILGFQASAQNAQDRLNFMDAYVGQNGTLRGAEQAWQDYLNANPIFDPNSEIAAPVLNPNRRSWQEHFGARAGASGGAQPTDDDALLNKYLGN